MSETPPIYHTQQDSGDETDVRLGAEAPPLPGTWVARFDAAYWQAQALDAQREVGYCHAQAATDLRALEQAEAELTQARAERDAALAQLAALREQLVTAESRCTSLRTALNRTNGLLSDERRAAAVQYRRSHLT